MTARETPEALVGRLREMLREGLDACQASYVEGLATAHGDTSEQEVAGRKADAWTSKISDWLSHDVPDGLLSTLRAQLAARDDVRVERWAFDAGYDAGCEDQNAYEHGGRQLGRTAAWEAHRAAIRALSPDPTPTASEREALEAAYSDGWHDRDDDGGDPILLVSEAWQKSKTLAALAPPAPASDAGTRVDAGQREGVGFDGGWLFVEDQVAALTRAAVVAGTNEKKALTRALHEDGYEVVASTRDTPPSGGDAAEVVRLEAERAKERRRIRLMVRDAAFDHEALADESAAVTGAAIVHTACARSLRNLERALSSPGAGTEGKHG